MTGLADACQAKDAQDLQEGGCPRAAKHFLKKAKKLSLWHIMNEMTLHDPYGLCRVIFSLLQHRTKGGINEIAPMGKHFLPWDMVIFGNVVFRGKWGFVLGRKPAGDSAWGRFCRYEEKNFKGRCEKRVVPLPAQFSFSN